MNPCQVFRRLKFEFFASGSLLGQESCPSLSTVYRILRPIIRSEQTRQSPRKGQQPIILPKFSNEVWWANLIWLSIEVENCFGELAGSPVLAIFQDGFSKNIVGLKLALSDSPEEALLLALRHAILPKQFDEENAPVQGWTACGFPKHLVVKEGTSFSTLARRCSALGIECHQVQHFWIMAPAIESFNDQLMDQLALLHERTDQQVVRLSLAELDRFITRYVVEHYNQQISREDPHCTRTERWETGLVKFPPDVPPERSLDICLPAAGHRVVQRSGCVQFEGQIYRDENLSSHVGEQVFLRYNPSNVTTVLVYQQQGTEENLLARACIRDFHEERLSLNDAQAIRRRQRQQEHPG